MHGRDRQNGGSPERRRREKGFASEANCSRRALAHPPFRGSFRPTALASFDFTSALSAYLS